MSFILGMFACGGVDLLLSTRAVHVCLCVCVCACTLYARLRLCVIVCVWSACMIYACVCARAHISAWCVCFRERY